MNKNTGESTEEKLATYTTMKWFTVACLPIVPSLVVMATGSSGVTDCDELTCWSWYGISELKFYFLFLK